MVLILHRFFGVRGHDMVRVFSRAGAGARPRLRMMREIVVITYSLAELAGHFVPQLVGRRRIRPAHQVRAPIAAEATTPTCCWPACGDRHRVLSVLSGRALLAWLLRIIGIRPRVATSNCLEMAA